jgi:multidrug efflux pump subunit AcrA (membrane-fusion protein)
VRRAPLAALLTAAVLTLTAASCESADDGVATDAVRRATFAEVVDVPASVTARAAAVVTAPADGRVVKLTVTSGVRVKRNQVIAVIDSKAARTRLADAKAALNAANAGLGGIGVPDLGGVQTQVDRAAAESFASARAAAGHVSDAKVRAALLAQVKSAQKHYDAISATARRVVGQVESGLAGVGDAVAALGAAQRVQAKAAYDLAKAAVDALTLRAPIAGVVQVGGAAGGGSSGSITDLLGAVTAGGVGSPAGPAAGSGATGASAPLPGVDDVLAVGDVVGVGTPVATIVDVSELGLVGEVDETDVLLVSPGLDAEVELDAAPGASYSAKVSSVDLLPTPSTRGGVAYRIRLSLDVGRAADGDQRAPTPRPGMSAVAHLRVREATDAVAVPAAAVFGSGGRDVVWVVRDGKAVEQPVRVGVQGVDLVQILDGVADGEVVVVSGTDRVQAGQHL